MRDTIHSVYVTTPHGYEIHQIKVATYHIGWIWSKFWNAEGQLVYCIRSKWLHLFLDTHKES